MKRFAEKVAISKTVQGHIVRDTSPEPFDGKRNSIKSPVKIRKVEI